MRKVRVRRLALSAGEMYVSWLMSLTSNMQHHLSCAWQLISAFWSYTRGAMFYWERQPDGPFVTLIAVAATYLNPETWDLESLQRLAKREGHEEMRVFKAELRQALRDPSQLPGEELSESVEYSNGSDEAFLRWLWCKLYGDEPFSTDVITRLRALPEPFAERVPWQVRSGVRKAVWAGEWGQALEVLVAGLIENSVPVSPAERGELTTMLEAAGQPAGPVARLSVGQPGAVGPASNIRPQAG